jgi:putative PIN family toxin of toxin-antitoxin system
MRVMLDTNVLLSMFLFPSTKMNKLKHNLCEQHTILLCSYVIEETKDVVSRKFKSKETELVDFLRTFPFELVYTPLLFEAAEYPKIRDISDLPILVSAILDDADVLISGDNDFSDVIIERPEILKPADFIKKYI